MGEDRIFVPELAILGLWLGAPAFILGLTLQGRFLWRRGLGRSGQRGRLVLVLLASAVLSYFLTFVFWIGMPEPLRIWDGRFGDGAFMFLGVFLVPAVVALAVVCPGMSWLALRKRVGSPTTGCS